MCLCTTRSKSEKYRIEFEKNPQRIFYKVVIKKNNEFVSPYFNAQDNCLFYCKDKITESDREDIDDPMDCFYADIADIIEIHRGIHVFYDLEMAIGEAKWWSTIRAESAMILRVKGIDFVAGDGVDAVFMKVLVLGEIDAT